MAGALAGREVSTVAGIGGGTGAVEIGLEFFCAGAPGAGALFFAHQNHAPPMAANTPQAINVILARPFDASKKRRMADAPGSCLVLPGVPGVLSVWVMAVFLRAYAIQGINFLPMVKAGAKTKMPTGDAGVLGLVLLMAWHPEN